MGIIQRQTIKGTAFAYLGIVIGFITTAILFPKILAKDEIGITRLLISYALIFSQFASLGFTNVTMRLFPYFRNRDLQHHGFLKLSIIVALMGFIFVCLIFLIIKPFIVQNEESQLFNLYIWYVLPLTFFFAFFNIFEAYNRVIYDSVTGIFLKEFLQRFLILLAVLIYSYGQFEFSSFVFLYFFALSIPTVFLIAKIKKSGQLFLTNPISSIDKTFRHEIAIVSFFGILQGFSLIAVSNIDVVMLSWYVDLDLIGIYATNVVFGILIIIPSRPLMKISSTILANAWKENDMGVISKIYYKSCLSQYIIAMFIFIGVWSNIHNLYSILPQGFEQGKWVVFFIMLANLSEMLTGLNGTIINTSRYYKASALFIGLLVLMIIGLNTILIPVFGITGAAIGVFISNASNSFFKYLFLYRKFKMNPLDIKFVYISIFGILSYWFVSLLPILDPFILDSVVRSSLITALFGLFIYTFKILPETNIFIQKTISNILNKIFIKIKL